MNSQHRAIRALIAAMAPNRAIDYIKSFNLPAEEEYCLIECDVKRRCYAELVTDKDKPFSPEVIKKRKNSAYAHIADQINSTK